MRDFMSNQSRQNISSGTKWEALAGYSRAVRIGNTVAVSGTTATDENGNIVGPNDPYAQTVYAIRKIERALHQAGARLEDVIRTRIFIVRTPDWEEVCRAHGEIFGTIRPVNTLVTVKELIGVDYLVEVEADAIITPVSE
jgi:enamine deaminase RidA (YjgF/YER057c/UK114 family)